jgi:hypothetical protein
MNISEIKNDDLKTLAQCSNTMKKYGFDKDFQITEQGLKSMDMDKIYQPEDVKIVNFYRFEGESDPADMAILYVMETNDGMKGTLVDAYGTYSARKVQDFILQVEEIQKRTDKP